MGLPLFYYVYPFQSYFGDPIFPMLQSFPVSFRTTYILIFSATKQVGALPSSLAFLTASSLVSDDRVRKSLLISAIGMAILIGSIEITPLQYHVYPPYGIVTMAFLPLGVYFLFIGIFVSAKNISRDAELRREFYKCRESTELIEGYRNLRDGKTNSKSSGIFREDHSLRTGARGIK